MYFIVKYDIFKKTREVIDQTEDPVEAYVKGNMFDAKFKTGLEEDEVGQPGVFVSIEDETKHSCWQKCSDFYYQPTGLFV